MKKPAFCACENKRADQLRVCSRYKDGTIPVISKSDISNPLAIFGLYIGPARNPPNIYFLAAHITQAYRLPNLERYFEKNMLKFIIKVDIDQRVCRFPFMSPL